MACSVCRDERLIYDSPDEPGRICLDCAEPCPWGPPGKPCRPVVTRPYPWVVTCPDHTDDTFQVQGVDLHSVRAAVADWDQQVDEWRAEHGSLGYCEGCGQEELVMPVKGWVTACLECRNEHEKREKWMADMEGRGDYERDQRKDPSYRRVG